jgi:predicted RNA-binding protein associated with RNAse of E/G family
MRFKISRTSGWDNDPPCKEAYTLPEEYNPKDHYHKWYIDINSLDELIKFVDKYGDIVVSTENDPYIEIYDTYRE